MQPIIRIYKRQKSDVKNLQNCSGDFTHIGPISPIRINLNKLHNLKILRHTMYLRRRYKIIVFIFIPPTILIDLTVFFPLSFFVFLLLFDIHLKPYHQ